ncbi:MAG: DNA alkylation response protein [Alphaproteobacteria bacterium]|nr:DNA alkylation response protein [Alphaproteobacteria bacterium]
MNPAAPRSRATDHQPETRGQDFFALDRSLRTLLGLYLSAPLRAHLEPHYRRLGRMVPDRLEDLAASADRNGPELRPRDRAGRDIWSVEFHPAYRDLERIAFVDFELGAMSHRPALGWNSPLPPVAKYAFTYLFSQSEFGLCCPINMTDSTARMLKLFASDEIKARYLPRLLADSIETMQHGTMWITERFGGSDVGELRTVARFERGEWRLYGDKWFSSVANADMALVLARPEGAGAGTKGLGLFLVPRRLPDGSHNAYRAVRLKDKLGTRSMASAEMVFEGAVGYVIGDLARGFVQMAEMINQSRISNGIRAAALMRRSLFEALAVAEGRVAFGSRLKDLPLMRRQLLKLLLPAEQALSVGLFTADLLEKADAGDGRAAGALRLATPVLKFRACRDARKSAGDGMETRGGSGYVEEWPHARILRDSHLGSIWEGTSNIVALDILRAIRREQADAPLRALLEEKLATAPADLRPALAERLNGAFALAGRAVAGEERLARQAGTALYHAMSAVLFAWEAKADPARLWLARLVLAHKLAPRDPLAPDDPGLEDAAMAALLPN